MSGRLLMAKRTNRVAWGLAAVLALAVLGGIGQMLDHGIQIGTHEVRLLPTDHWHFGIEPLTPPISVFASLPRAGKGLCLGGCKTAVWTRWPAGEGLPPPNVIVVLLDGKRWCYRLNDR
jgi:hypothetical protein